MFKVVALLAEMMADSFSQSVKANVVLCLRENGERVHRFLDDHGFLDSTWKPKPTGKMLALPFNQHVSGKEIEHMLGSFFDFEIQIDCIELERPAISNNPHAQLHRVIVSWLASFNTSGVGAEFFTKELPDKWQHLGDLVILPETAFVSKQWVGLFERMSTEELQKLWREISESLGGKRLARQHPIAKDKHRTSQTELLQGENGWVEFLDHGVHFGFDATKVMFSSGNVTERRRIGSVAMEGEVVVDAYAGVGYYALHMALRSQAKHIHACEINPDSITGLSWAQEANELNEKMTIHQGDNQETLPKLYGQADRCHLGLLPSSEAVWEHAIACLKPKGGWLHIHMNVEKNKFDEWQSTTLETLKTYALRHGRRWEITAPHLERVKWFSPHVWHVVLDVQCREIQ
jgi:tRNA wybutosine-synthesizing protein 3